MIDGEGCGMESIMVSYKFWDFYQSDANSRDALDIVLPLYLCLFLLMVQFLLLHNLFFPFNFNLICILI